MAMAVLGMLAQPLIDPSPVNIVCACIVFTSSMIVMLYLCWTKALDTDPLSSFVVLGFCVTTQLGALVVQSMAWTSLTLSLYDPLYTFSILALFLAIAVAVHAVYRFFSANSKSEHSLIRGMLGRLGLYQTPSAGSLWIMGWIGLISFYFTAGTGTLSKIGGAANFLAWAPFLIPIYLLQFGDRYCNARRMMGLLALQAALIAIVGIAVNVRSTMFFAIITAALLCLLQGLRSNRQMTGRFVMMAAIFAAVVGLLFQPLSNLVVAMAVARNARGKISASEMVENTFYILQRRPDLIEAFKKQEAVALRSSYDETYIANSMLSRLVETKFHDNALHFGRGITTDEDRARLRAFTINSCWAALPTPLLKVFGVTVRKEDLQFSMGDYLVYLSRGGMLGGYRTGSLFGEGLVLFGNLFTIVYAAACLIVFYMLGLMTSPSATGQASICAPAMMKIWPLFLHGITCDAVSVLFIFIVRGFIEMVLVYLLALSVTRLLLRDKYLFA